MRGGKKKDYLFAFPSIVYIEFIPRNYLYNDIQFEMALNDIHPTRSPPILHLCVIDTKCYPIYIYIVNWYVSRQSELFFLKTFPTLDNDSLSICIYVGIRCATWKKKKINWSVVNRYFNCDSIPVFDFRRINRFKKNIRERSIEMYPKLTANMEGGGGKNKWIKYRNFSYDRYCDASFLECLRYLEGVIEQTALKRQDDTITAINEQKWVVPDNMQQIQSVQKECLNAMERDKKVMPPFEGPIGK